MRTKRGNNLALLAAALISFGIVGTSQAGEQRSDVVGEADIQTQIDQRIGNEKSDRQAIQSLLQRPEVRRIAGTAGLDIGRANAAVGVLSGPDLKDIASRAREINGVVGGRETVTISVVALVIILLLIIILAD
jgi:hypothetical protein